MFPFALLLILLVPGAGPRAKAREGDDLGPLEIQLRDRDKWVRQRAAQRLGRAGTREAWELLLGALGDPAGEVADAAQLALGAVSDPWIAERLAGKPGLGSRDAMVRARAAEAFGRLAFEVDAGALLRAFSGAEADERRMLCWSLERLACAGRIPEDDRYEVNEALGRVLRRDREGGVRGRALFALAVLDPQEAAGDLEDLARERDPALRCAVAGLASELLAPERAAALLAELAGDRSLDVRTRAAEALPALATREALAILVERLELEPEERLAWRVLDALRRASGLKHRRDPRPWRDWIAKLPADGSRIVPVRSDAPPEPGATAAALAGLPILSGRLAFLIDLSGSVWHTRPDGRTRKEIIDGKLAEALASLPETTRFNLIPYTGVPHPWRAELTPVRRASVEEASAFFRGCDERGSGNFWDAALLALADPEVDTLVVLTDGVPTGGRGHSELALLVPLLLERVATRPVAIDSILVDAPGPVRRHWAVLAEGSGGLSIAVELE